MHTPIIVLDSTAEPLASLGSSPLQYFASPPTAQSHQKSVLALASPQTGLERALDVENGLLEEILHHV